MWEKAIDEYDEIDLKSDSINDVRPFVQKGIDFTKDDDDLYENDIDNETVEDATLFSKISMYCFAHNPCTKSSAVFCAVIMFILVFAFSSFGTSDASVPWRSVAYNTCDEKYGEFTQGKCDFFTTFGFWLDAFSSENQTDYFDWITTGNHGERVLDFDFRNSSASCQKSKSCTLLSQPLKIEVLREGEDRFAQTNFVNASVNFSVAWKLVRSEVEEHNGLPLWYTFHKEYNFDTYPELPAPSSEFLSSHSVSQTCSSSFGAIKKVKLNDDFREPGCGVIDYRDPSSPDNFEFWQTDYGGYTNITQNEIANCRNASVALNGCAAQSVNATSSLFMSDVDGECTGICCSDRALLRIRKSAPKCFLYDIVAEPDFTVDLRIVLAFEGSTTNRMLDIPGIKLNSGSNILYEEDGTRVRLLAKKSHFSKIANLDFSSISAGKILYCGDWQNENIQCPVNTWTSISSQTEPVQNARDQLWRFIPKSISSRYSSENVSPTTLAFSNITLLEERLDSLMLHKAKKYGQTSGNIESNIADFLNAVYDYDIDRGIQVCEGIYNETLRLDEQLQYEVQHAIFQNIPGYAFEKDADFYSMTLNRFITEDGAITPSLCSISSSLDEIFFPPLYDFDSPNFFVGNGLDTNATQRYLFYTPSSSELLKIKEQLKNAFLLEIDVSDSLLGTGKTFITPMSFAPHEDFQKTNCWTNDVDADLEDPYVANGFMNFYIKSKQSDVEKLIRANDANPISIYISCEAEPGKHGFTPAFVYEEGQIDVLDHVTPDKVYFYNWKFKIDTFSTGFTYKELYNFKGIDVAKCTISINPFYNVYDIQTDTIIDERYKHVIQSFQFESSTVLCKSTL